jgi:hypothetical protein
LSYRAIHPVLILFSSTAKFRLIDIVYPVNAPKQPWINVLGPLVLTDPNLKDQPIDFLDGEKVYVELCLLIVIVAVILRIRWQLRQPAPRVHRQKQPRQSRHLIVSVPEDS